jgi:hypothetical protein
MTRAELEAIVVRQPAQLTGGGGKVAPADLAKARDFAATVIMGNIDAYVADERAAAQEPG